jgi:hypothetical protein
MRQGNGRETISGAVFATVRCLLRSFGRGRQTEDCPKGRLACSGRMTDKDELQEVGGPT